MPDFLPRRDLDLLDWSANFLRQIIPAPEAVGLTPQIAAELAELQTAFAQAMALATTPATRTAGMIANKDDARDAMIRRIRYLNQVINGQPQVTDAQRSDRGLKRKIQGKPPIISAPTSAPGMQVVARYGNAVTVAVANAEVAVRRRPRGAAGAMFLTAIEDDAHWTYYGATTKPVMRVQFSAKLAPGTRVRIAACWTSPTGKRSPMAWLTTHVAGETTLAA